MATECYAEPARDCSTRMARMTDKSSIEQRVVSVPATVSVPPPAVPEPLEYPDSDGHFLPDNPLQANAVVELRNSLREHFRGVPNVVVEGDMFLYYARGEADERRVLGRRVGKFVAPDLIVVLGHDLGDRSTYKLWEEGKPPDFALEVVSPPNEVRNRRDKKELYERIRIREYFVFQPDQARTGPRLVGYELKGSGYRQLGPDPELAREAESMRSEVLGVSFRPEGAFLRVRDLQRGKDYPWSAEWGAQLEEATAARRRAEERADEEAAARHREAAARHREAEVRRQAEERADEEAEARRRAEARLAALEATLGRHGL